MHPSEQPTPQQRRDPRDHGAASVERSAMRAIDCGARDDAREPARPAARGRGVPRGAPFAGAASRPDEQD